MRPIVIAAGGTGGHFFPAEALAAELIRRGQRVVLMTDSRSGGLSSDVFAGRERYVVRGSGVAGRGALRAVKSVASLTLGTLQARGLLIRLDACCVVGFGGYPCIPPVLASRVLRHRPAVILHEQNAVLGRANRALARRATVLALSYDDTALVPHGTRTTQTGNPVRPAVAALAAQPYFAAEETFRLLVLGGSLGARVFSDVVPEALALLPEPLRARLCLTQQCRPEDIERVRAAYAESGIRANLAPFFPDVATLLASAHLVIARAGASTVAELAVAGRPSVLVPLPGAIDDHQSANARALAEAGGAWVMPQSRLTARTLAQCLEPLLTSPSMLSTAAAKAAALGEADAAARLADLVELTIRQESRT